MLTLVTMQDNSTLMRKLFNISGWSSLIVSQVFHTVRIVLYIRCSGSVVGSLTYSY